MSSGSTRRGFLRILLSAASLVPLGVSRAWAAIVPQRPRPLPPTTAAPAVAAPAGARTIKLSAAAVQSPLPEKSWVSFFRNFMTRSGSWRGHPVEARQLARREGRIAVLGPERVPVDQALGIGNIRDAGGGGIACTTNVCDAQGVVARSSCASLSCGKNSCADLQCQIDQCSAQNCAKHSCQSHSMQIADIAGDLQANWDSAFVRELRQQFGVDNTTALAQAVTSFVQRNGYAPR